MKKLIALICAALAIVLSVPQSARAIDMTGWTTPSFHSDIVISKDSVATITETIEFDFGSSAGHGIKRYIPTTTQVANTGSYNNYDFHLLSITRDGIEEKVRATHEGYYEYLRIGNPNRTISGKHIYSIRYTMKSVIEQTPFGDMFNWNVTPDKWDQPISMATATVTFPNDVTPQKYGCYTGTYGSREKNCTVTADKNALKITANQKTSTSEIAETNYTFAPGEGMTVNVFTKSGSFTNYLVPASNPKMYWQDYAAAIEIALFIALALIIRLIAFIVDRMRKRAQTVIAEYEPPDDLRPAQTSRIANIHKRRNEISATIIDLAVRKYIRINQIKAKSLFSPAKYEFEVLKSTKDKLTDFEQSLFSLFTGAVKEVDGKQIATTDRMRTSGASKVSSFMAKLQKSLTDKSYFYSATKSKRTRMPAFWFAILTLPLWIASMILWWDSGVFFTGAIAIAVGIAITAPKYLAKDAYDEWAKVQGFKLFLSVTEKDRMAFHDAPAKNPQQFSDYLPYAIALGVEKQWAKQFEDVDMPDQYYWYGGTGTHIYTPLYIANSLGSEFSSSINTSVAPISSGSSGGGGGFSGGGGGGGGGGGW